MEDSSKTARTFAYRAQTATERPVTGTVDAADHDEAIRLLEAMNLRVVEVAEVRSPPAARAMRGRDFQAFNEQLAYLTKAGLPVEAGLRFIARETRGRSMRRAIEQVAAEAEAGKPLAEAFDAQRQAFPPLYGRLIDAGVRSGNLPGVLFNLGRHLEMVQRLHAVLWQNLAYPGIVLLAMVVLLLCMGTFVLPQFHHVFDDFGMGLPLLTMWLMNATQYMPWLLGGTVAVIILAPLLWAALGPWQPAIVDSLLLPIPLLGSVLRAGRNARWCDALSLGIDAGLDLPQAMRLATDVMNSPKVRRDTERLLALLESGGRLDDVGRLSVLNGAVGATLEAANGEKNRGSGPGAPGQAGASGGEKNRGSGISDLGSGAGSFGGTTSGVAGGGLASMLRNLAMLNQQQAETRLRILDVGLTPFLLLVLAMIVGFTILALFLPLVKLIQCLS